MSQLGFTFYPKDWWTSETFYTLSPYERYIYLELLFIMYSNDGFVIDNKTNVERRLATSIKDEVWVKITDLFVKDGDKLTHESVNKRLAKAMVSRANGMKGGRPKKEVEKPREPRKITQNNPALERERERESKIEKEIESKIEVFKPIRFSPPSLSDIEKFITEKNYNSVNAGAFFNFYASKGWMVGKSKMKDWKLAVAGWHARNNETKPQPNAATQSRRNYDDRA